MADLATRLLSRVDRDSDPNGCWEWTGAKDAKGYGQIKVNGVLKRTHRVSYAVFMSVEPASLHVCHRCDNPSCIRPDHLFLGTNKQNMEDREKKGRGVRTSGPKHHNFKVTDDMASDIRRSYGSGEKQRDIGARLGISQYAVWWTIHNERTA
jgi:hypothetical protein